MYVRTPQIGFGATAVNQAERDRAIKENEARKKKYADAIKKHDKAVALYQSKLSTYEATVKKLTDAYAAAQSKYLAASSGISAGNASATAQYNAAISRWNAQKLAYDQAMAERDRIISSGRGAVASASAQILAKWKLPPPPGYPGCLTPAQRAGYQNECAATNLRGLGDASRSACGYQELPLCPQVPPLPGGLPTKPAPPKLSSLPSAPQPPKMPARPADPGPRPPPPKLMTVPAEVFAPPPPKPPMRSGDPKPLEPPPVVVYEEPSEGGGNFAVVGILGILAVGTAGYFIFRKKRPAAA
jgi:hypothetical protein